MDMSYTMDSSQNGLYTTFPNIFSLISTISADLSKSQKNHILKKKLIFLIENRLQRGQNGSNKFFRYGNMKFLLIFSVTSSAKIVKENISKNFIFPYRKMIFVGLQGMFMRTWDQPRFPIGPVLTSLEPIFDQKNRLFFQNMIFLTF